MRLAHTVGHFVYPKSSNNHRAKVLHNSFLTLIVLALLAYQAVIQFIPTVNPQVLGYAANISVSEVIKLTNQKRVEAGLLPVEQNEALTLAAQAKGAHMLKNNYWAHNAPDGTEPWKFFVDVGYKYKFAGENLARDFSDPVSAVSAWMASPTHRDNMLSSKYNEIGIGVVEGDLSGTDTTIIVQFFGTKLSDSIPISPIAVNVPEATVSPAAIALVSPEPTSVPATTPEQTAAPVAATVIETSEPSEPTVLVSPFNITRGVSIGLIIFLLVVVVVDALVISRKKITRAVGRSFAHFAFFGMILAILLIAKAGQIL